MKKITLFLAASIIVFSFAPLMANAQTTSVQAQLQALEQQLLQLQNQANNTSPASTPTAMMPATATGYAFTASMTVGSQGSEVSALQQILINDGYLTAIATPSGYFGQATKTALIQYQQANSISPATGYFGLLTMANVNAKAIGETTSAGNQNSATVNQTTPVPVSQPTPPPPALVVSCSPAQSTLTTGQTGVWTAQASGGVENYSYSWSGTSGLSGNSESASINYGSAGTESASVVVTSGSQSVNQTCNGTITVSNPAPTPTPQTNSQNTSLAPGETVSQANAVAKAIDYLNYAGFSYEGLIAQLEYDQFSQSDATYGADNSGANWDAEAAEKAKEYMGYSAFSSGGLIAQLEYDKFTPEQAEYGANAVGL